MSKPNWCREHEHRDTKQDTCPYCEIVILKQEVKSLKNQLRKHYEKSQDGHQEISRV